MVTACVWRSIINFCVMLSYGEFHYFGSELHPSWGWNRVHVRFPKWPSLHDLVISIVQREKGQQGIWSFNSVCGIHNAQGEEGEMVWPVQCWGCWPWCFLILLNRKMWELLCFWTVSEIIGIWVSSSTENPRFLIRCQFFFQRGLSWIIIPSLKQSYTGVLKTMWISLIW